MIRPAMTTEETLEMYKRNLERRDFTEDDKRATRLNIRKLMMEKMDEPVCAADDHCIESATHEYMKDIWICRPHHEKGFAIAVCARCASCQAWVILFPRATNPEPTVYEFTCPVRSCGASVRVQSNQTKPWGIPNAWTDRGYFCERELRDI